MNVPDKTKADLFISLIYSGLFCLQQPYSTSTYLSRRTCRTLFFFSSLVRTVHCFLFLLCLFIIILLCIRASILRNYRFFLSTYLSVCLPLRLCLHEDHSLEIRMKK